VKILVIQPAFIGDVIMTTGVLEKLHHTYPAAKIDYLVRKGNEDLLKDHPYLHEVLVWDKSRNKYSNLWKMMRKVRSGHYEYVINVHRFITTGLISVFSGAKHTHGFENNPLSFLYSKRYPYEVGKGKHEFERNHELIREITDDHVAKSRLYPSKADFAAVEKYKHDTDSNTPLRYITIGPASVWFTKQFPTETWIEWIKTCHNKAIRIYLLGGPGDAPLCERMRAACPEADVVNLAGKLSLLESAALMASSEMNYANDSGPMHMASAMNAPITAIFTSTAPILGFTPRSDRTIIVEANVKLDCRPCGLHGHKVCPKKHFKCALLIRPEDVPVVK
jgi:ADP-heptose:LPS heptosyltransferase